VSTPIRRTEINSKIFEIFLDERASCLLYWWMKSFFSRTALWSSYWRGQSDGLFVGTVTPPNTRWDVFVPAPGRCNPLFPRLGKFPFFNERRMLRKMTSRIGIIVLLTIPGALLAHGQSMAPCKDSSKPVDVRVDDLFKRITLQEKANQVQSHLLLLPDYS
jgi:hypothetical protein